MLRPSRPLLLLVLVLWVSAACSPVAPAPAPPTTAPTLTAAPPTPTATPAPTATLSPPSPTPTPTRWTVALVERPSNLLPFSPDGRAAAPVVAALFPPPVLALGYTFTSTGILEGLPTLATGDVRMQTAQGFLDSTGQFTTTPTAEVTTTSQLIVTFHWRRDLRWGDGAPLTAADSVWAYEQARSGLGLSEASGLLDLVADYRLVDDWTTEAVLPPGRTDPSYPLAAWPPLPRHLLADAGRNAFAEFASAPLGYGPFSSVVQSADAITLVRNPYWPAATLPDELVFRFYPSADELRAAVAAGAADLGWLEQVPPELFAQLDQDQADGALAATFVAGPVYEHLDFNLDDPLLRESAVRRAIALAVNRPALTAQFAGGHAPPLHSWVLPQQPEYAGDEQLTRYGYDPAQASALLAGAGLLDTDGDGVRERESAPATLTLLTSDAPLRLGVTAQIAADLAAVGLAVTVQALPTAELYSPTGPLFRREFQLAEFGWLAGAVPNGVPLWSCAAIPGVDNGFVGNNFAGWCAPGAEGALRRGAAALQPRERAANALRQQRVWAQALPSLSLFQRPLALLQRPTLLGPAPDALAPITWNVAAWQRVAP